MTHETQPGFFGKLPGRGDFVSRRLPRDFQDAWDAWLQKGMATSRAQLGESWLGTYLASPIWRFALSADLCGHGAWSGVLMPSVDRVGRYFPLTIAVRAEVPVEPVVMAGAGRDWFDAAETLALSALDEDQDFDLEQFSEAVADLGQCAPPTAEGTMPEALPAEPWRLALRSVQSPENALLPLLGALVHERMGRYSAWWSAGSELVEPSVLLCPGLAGSESFAGLLDGQWHSVGWSSLVVDPDADA